MSTPSQQRQLQKTFIASILICCDKATAKMKEDAALWLSEVAHKTSDPVAHRLAMDALSDAIDFDLVQSPTRNWCMGTPRPTATVLPLRRVASAS
jgi:hypothetical protein